MWDRKLPRGQVGQGPGWEQRRLAKWGHWCGVPPGNRAAVGAGSNRGPCGISYAHTERSYLQVPDCEACLWLRMWIRRIPRVLERPSEVMRPLAQPARTAACRRPQPHRRSSSSSACANPNQQQQLTATAAPRTTPGVTREQPNTWSRHRLCRRCAHPPGQQQQQLHDSGFCACACRDRWQQESAAMRPHQQHWTCRGRSAARACGRPL